ncbi:unnamed protein product [Orchesella dallaii]|uniref:C2H2-type domain-containing protein n=1 Tax=Orchesella dallaii TaxID=48710 RepID=A0ABP1S9R9_9HEXA
MSRPRVKTVYCLVCGQPPSSFDNGGKLVTKCCTNSTHTPRQLFLYLCQSLKMTTMSRKRRGTWNFEKEPFPFCETCELFLNSLAEVYSELHELEKVLRDKMIDGELKYSSDKLYSQLDQRYFSFRKEALKGKFVGDEEHSISPFSILPDMLSSGSDQHESENDEAVVTLSLDDSLGDNQLPLITSVSSLSSRTEIESDNTGDNNNILLRDVSSKPKRAEDEAKEEDQIFLVVETGPSDENGKSLIMQDGLASSERGNENEKTTRKRKVAQSPSSASFFTKKRRINRRGLPKRPTKKALKELERERRKKEEGVARLEVELPYLKDTADNHNGTMKTDRTKGTVTYTTSYGGNLYKKKTCVMIFKEIKDEEGTLTCYECEMCSQTVPSSKRRRFTSMRNMEQRSFFHQHYLRYHTKRFNCLLCPDLNSVGNGRQELLDHLKEKHHIGDIQAYSKIRERHSMLRHLNVVQGKCEICEKPFPDFRKKEYRDHRWTHLNEDEKRQVINNRGRHWNEIHPPSDERLSSGAVNQCQTCGLFISGGRSRLKAHELLHLAREGKPSFICFLCGKGFGGKQGLDLHMKRKHPEGKFSDSNLKCNYPNCEVDFGGGGGEKELEQHVEEAHGESGEKEERRMCRKCGKVLGSPWACKQHQKVVHSNEKPHQCHICEKRFNIKRSLTDHLAGVHREGTEERRCQVEGCERSFHCGYSFRNHMRSTHSIFVKGDKAKAKLKLIGNQSKVITAEASAAVADLTNSAN